MTTQHGRRQLLLIALVAVTLLVLIASIRYGAIDFSIAEIGNALASLSPGRPKPTLDQRIFLELRFPRAILCLLVGASLGVGGTLMQALFRNPIVEPGLVGTSSGAAFGSALFFVLGGVFHFGVSRVNTGRENKKGKPLEKQDCGIINYLTKRLPAWLSKWAHAHNMIFFS